MMPFAKRFSPTLRILLTIMLAVSAILFAFICSGDYGPDVYATEKTVQIKNWTITDSDGNTKNISLPYTFAYGTDGCYTLSAVLPNDVVDFAPVFMFYSNYIDFSLTYGGKVIYEYPANGKSGVTGNSYHFIRLDENYGGKTVEIKVRAQLEDGITYYLTPPVIGAKATIMHKYVENALPPFVIASCLVILSIILVAMHFIMKHAVHSLNFSLYLGIFAFVFAFYIMSEIPYFLIGGGMPDTHYVLTFILLSLFPIPLCAYFAHYVTGNARTVARVVVWLCVINFSAQAVLHFSGAFNYRVMLPATHATLITAIVVLSISLIVNGRKSRGLVYAALPMIAGGLADIILLMIDRPSINNTLWFMCGVVLFIIIQFVSFIRSCLIVYSEAVESRLMRRIAYTDALTGLGNRHAYEEKLKDIQISGDFSSVGCIFTDINGLKYVNDHFGHPAGDALIAATGKALRNSVPESAECFRTGGDEFVVIADSISPENIREYAEGFVNEIRRISDDCHGLSVSVGFGCFSENDKDLLDFISRIDSEMYENKQEYKRHITENR